MVARNGLIARAHSESETCRATNIADTSLDEPCSSSSPVGRTVSRAMELESHTQSHIVYRLTDVLSVHQAFKGLRERDGAMPELR